MVANTNNQPGLAAPPRDENSIIIFSIRRDSEMRERTSTHLLFARFCAHLRLPCRILLACSQPEACLEPWPCGMREWRCKSSARYMNMHDRIHENFNATHNIHFNICVSRRVSACSHQQDCEGWDYVLPSCTAAHTRTPPSTSLQLGTGVVPRHSHVPARSKNVQKI